MSRPTPAQDLAGYLRSFPEEMAFGDEDPGVVLDRYYTSDFVHVNDGVTLDRDRLIAHAKPARKNVLGLELEIHDVVIADDTAAAHYTLHSDMRAGRRITSEVYMFGKFAADGRLRRVESTSRILPVEGSG